MSIVKILSNLIRDPSVADSYAPDPLEARGRLIIATGTVENGADDSSGSMYHLADIPSHVLLHEDTFFDVENDGFAQIVIGTETDTDALVDQTKATEDLITPISQGDAFHGKRLWEVLGFSEDPRRMISLYKHAEADAAAAGSMPFRIAYIAN